MSQAVISKDINSHKKINDHILEALFGWVMAGPAIILLFGFLIIPFFMAFGFALTNQRLISPNPTEFVGFRNFANLITVRVLTLDPLTDPVTGQVLLDDQGLVKYPAVRDYTRNNKNYPQYSGLQEWKSWVWGQTKWILLAGDTVFMKSLFNTLSFTLVVVPLQSGLALFLAVLINQRIRGINIFRTIYFMPVVISMVVVSILWRFIYAGQNGLLNNLLSFISFGHFQPIDWLGDPSTALGAIIFMSIWQAVGFHMVIWLAGLQTIPESLYEAAALDGANTWQVFQYVTWPGLRNTAVFILVTITTQAFGLFTQIYVMTNGGPLDSTTTVIFQAFQKGYVKQDIAYGSAISVVFFVLVLLVALIQRYLTRERE
jgi:multiple sugar transport system permease protein